MTQTSSTPATEAPVRDRTSNPSSPQSTRQSQPPLQSSFSFRETVSDAYGGGEEASAAWNSQEIRETVSRPDGSGNEASLTSWTQEVRQSQSKGFSDACIAGFESPSAASGSPVALRGEDISVGYGDRLIIAPMNVEIPLGKVTTIIGSNGCGKSTLLKALARILPVRSGAVYLDGKAIAKMSSTEIARQMALLPQSPEAPSGLTVSELVAYGRYPHQRGLGRLTSQDKELIDQALTMTFMDEFADRPLDELSGGQRQRAWIAMALAQDTDIILLDEPTTYLDLSHQLEVLELLRELNQEQGKTVALVIHELNLAARYADWMIAMKDGAVAYLGTPDEVMTPAMMRDIFSLDALIETDPWSGRPSVVGSRLLR